MGSKKEVDKKQHVGESTERDKIVQGSKRRGEGKVPLLKRNMSWMKITQYGAGKKKIGETIRVAREVGPNRDRKYAARY